MYSSEYTSSLGQCHSCFRALLLTTCPPFRERPAAPGHNNFSQEYLSLHAALAAQSPALWAWHEHPGLGVHHHGNTGWGCSSRPVPCILGNHVTDAQCLQTPTRCPHSTATPAMGEDRGGQRSKSFKLSCASRHHAGAGIGKSQGHHCLYPSPVQLQYVLSPAV